ncbi:hypothetical protein L9F63_022878, partial [Diploptera punctata]
LETISSFCNCVPVGVNTTTASTFPSAEEKRDTLYILAELNVRIWAAARCQIQLRNSKPVSLSFCKNERKAKCNQIKKSIIPSIVVPT